MLFVIAMTVREDGPDYIAVISLSAFGFMVWLLGLFIGVIISVIAQKPYREHWYYIAGQVIVIGGVIYLILNNIYEARRHQKNYGNIESNHSFVDLDNRHTSEDEPVKKAFRKLESSFENPNAFHITKYNSYWGDTLRDMRLDSVFLVYFTYTVDKKELFSKVSVLEDTARIEILHGDARTDPEYLRIMEDWNNMKLEQLESIRESLKDLPDSTRRQLQDTIRKLLKE